MMYRAERRNGQIKCMEPEPQAYEFQHERNYIQAIEGARAFTQKCILTVGNQEEWARAMEQGYRDSPDDAVRACLERENSVSKEIAHLNYDDRNLSELAKVEKSAQEVENGNVPLAEVKETPIRRTKKITRA